MFKFLFIIGGAGVAEKSAIKSVAVVSSGGDSQGMNAAVRAVVRTGIRYGLTVYGIQRGYLGLLADDMKRMDARSVGDIIQRGGTCLQTARSKRFATPEGVKLGAEILRGRGIDGLIVIGGDGSYRGANELNKQGIRTMCIPGTIDNDIALTDFTIGFDTAVSVAVDAINKLRDTMSSHERCSVVEVMGRSCGDIALYAGLASGAETILVPEISYNIDDVAARMLEGARRGKRHSIIVVAEGAGKAEDIAQRLSAITDIEARYTVLGHIQRGGSPTHTDRILASRLGDYALRQMVAGESGQAVGVIMGDLVSVDISRVVNTGRAFNYELYRLAERIS
jgi:6-phosphofructokinase 1